jgi:hypothetical protein
VLCTLNYQLACPRVYINTKASYRQSVWLHVLCCTPSVSGILLSAMTAKLPPPSTILVPHTNRRSAALPSTRFNCVLFAVLLLIPLQRLAHHSVSSHALRWRAYTAVVNSTALSACARGCEREQTCNLQRTCKQDTSGRDDTAVGKRAAVS